MVNINTLIIIVLTCLIFDINILTAQVNLFINGEVKLDSCENTDCNSEILVYKNSLFLKKIKTDKVGKCRFSLDFNNYYLLITKKEKYITKEIIIDLFMPEGTIGEGFEPWPFKVTLYKKNEENLIKSSKMPLFKIRYFPNLDRFDYDSLYYNTVKNLIFNTQFGYFKNHSGMYKYGDNALLHHIYSNCMYPEELRDSAITGSAIFEVGISKTGQIDSIILLNKTHPLFEKEAKRVILLTNGNWNQLKENDSVLNYKVLLPIEFIRKCDNCKSNIDYLRAGIKQFNKDNYIKAKELFSFALKNNPLDYDALYNRAVCYLRLNDLTSACKDLFNLKQFGRNEGDDLLKKICK